MNSIETPPCSPAVLGPFVVWEGAFGAADLKAIEQYADGLPHENATVDGFDYRYDPALRKTKVAWIEQNALTQPFYDRLETIILSLNSQFFQYDLAKLEPIQYALYDGSEQGHFDWHVDYDRDTGHERPYARKLSISVQLSGPSHYEGGELQARVRSRIDAAPKTFGTVIAFPSYVLHRVTPVTSGVRKALVAWALGPDYR
ncbi:MAG TPA: 2OG-Fe(II) oxygenase [Rhizomicrobium sp.]|jgi:PKHD-type hydroxylase|nr:2OG-Fe(II) oxygenase [Rhizomicrobium sp.]